MAVMANQMMIGLFGHIRGDQVKRDTLPFAGKVGSSHKRI